MLSNLHKTTSKYWWRTWVTQKGSPISSKGDRANIKDKHRDKDLGMETHPGEGVVKEEVSKYQETLSPSGLWGVLESQMAT